MFYTQISGVPKFAYVPGKNGKISISGPVTSKTLNFLPGVSGYRRNLTPDEYEMYREFLEPDNDTVDEPTKAAIGTVLKADLVRLYSNKYFEKYPDQLAEQWHKVYMEFKNGIPKQPYLDKYLRARAELNAFERFLVTPTYQLVGDNKDLEDDLKNQAYYNLIKYQAAKLEKDTRIGAERAKQDAKREAKDQKSKDKAFVDKFTLEGKKRYKIWVTRNLSDYLDAVYGVSAFAKIEDYTKALWEKSTRDYITDLVNAEKLDPLDGLEIYRQSLDLALQSGSMIEFYHKRGKLFERLAKKHPILGVM